MWDELTSKHRKKSTIHIGQLHLWGQRNWDKREAYTDLDTNSLGQFNSELLVREAVTEAVESLLEDEYLAVTGGGVKLKVASDSATPSHEVARAQLSDTHWPEPDHLYVSASSVISVSTRAQRQVHVQQPAHYLSNRKQQHVHYLSNRNNYLSQQPVHHLSNIYNNLSTTCYKYNHEIWETQNKTTCYSLVNTNNNIIFTAYCTSGTRHN